MDKKQIMIDAATLWLMDNSAYLSHDEARMVAEGVLRAAFEAVPPLEANDNKNRTPTT